MRCLLVLVAILSMQSLAAAEIISIEFSFTPYVGDLQQKEVETAPGKAAVFLNNIPYAEQEIDKREVPVLFESREIAPAVWIPAQSIGPVLRKGKNVLRIEFAPADEKLPYQARLAWATVTDQVVREEAGPGQFRETNRSDEGREDRKAAGKVVFERHFIADFAVDRPWHHYSPVAALSDADKKQIAKIIRERAAAFEPDFSKVYEILKSMPSIDLAELRKAKCFDKGYAAGIRVSAVADVDIEHVLTGNPEVVVRSRTGQLYAPTDAKALDRVKEDDIQMCLIFSLSVVYPPKLVLVRTPSGAWEVVR